VASTESGDDSIYNMSRPTTKKLFFSFLFFQEEKYIFFKLFSPRHLFKGKKLFSKTFFLLKFFARRKLICLNLSNKRYFSGSKKPPYLCY